MNVYGGTGMRQDRAPDFVVPDTEAQLKPLPKLQPLTDEALAFLRSRGIGKETAERAGVGVTDMFHREAGGVASVPALAFPYQTQGQTYALKLRGIARKEFSCARAPRTFFNLDKIDPTKPIVIVEGEMDALACIEGGFENVISIPNGAPSRELGSSPNAGPDRRFRYVEHAADLLKDCPKIILATDNDEPGEILANELARRFGKLRCWRVSFGPGVKDANDALLLGKEHLQTAIETAQPLPVAGLYGADHFEAAVEKLFVSGLGKGFSTGYANLDEHYTVLPGQLTVVTGVPSHGKSELIDQLMVNLAENEGWRFAICSFENEPQVHIAKLISKRVRKPFFDNRNVSPMSRGEMDTAYGWVKDHFSFLYQADGNMAGIDDIIERLRAAVLRYGIRGAVIDPYNYILRDKNSSETDWISDMLTRIKVFAQAHDVHIWFVAHPTKLKPKEDGTLPVPGGYDISGSASWYAKADCGITVHRDPNDTSCAQVHVWKMRFSWVGKPGRSDLYYDLDTTRYADLSHATIPTSLGGHQGYGFGSLSPGHSNTSGHSQGGGNGYRPWSTARHGKP